MKKFVLLTSSLLFAATMAIAQDSPTTGSQEPGQNATTTTTQTHTSQGSTLRGCLSGSPDNYTLTDLNGTQYKLVGGDSTLQSAVGHEVEVNGTQSQSAETSSGNGETMAHAANSFQVSEVRDTGSVCKMASRSNQHPMDEKAPKGTTTTPEQPQLMAMLQQSTSVNPGTSNSSSSMSTTGTDTAQPAQSPSQGSAAPQSSPNRGASTGVGATQTTPPVTSQTPAGSSSPTSPAATTGTTPPAQSGTTAGAGANGGTSPNSTTPQSSGTTTPQPSSSQPQSANDANKPLYERQATDIPYAHGNTTSTPSTTTTTPH